MNEDEFSDYLADYADAMHAGDDFSSRLLTEQPEESANLKKLFELSNLVKAVLVPVRAPSFKASLRLRLERKQLERPRFRVLASRQNIVWMLVAAAGSLLSITGVVLLVIRKLKTPGKAKQSTATASI